MHNEIFERSWRALRGLMNHINHWPSRFVKPLVILVACFLILGLVWKIQDLQNKKCVALSLYPNGKNFAFTITDDPDANTLEKIKPVYDYLAEVGLRTTAAVFAFRATRTNGIPDYPSNYSPGDTCQRRDYLAYMKKLQQEGFEIALHGVSWGNDLRDVTIRGYEKFRDYFGTYPKMNIMHGQNLENVYWGKKVVSNGVVQSLLGLLLNRAGIPFSGEDPSSKYFWGDILQQRTKYVRLFGTNDIDTLRFNPSMPYHDPEKPYVNFWFSFSDGSGVNRFTKLLSQDNIAKLVKERGACIVYTHFAHDFVRNGELDEDFKRSIDRLVSQPDGWFVPGSMLIDRLLLMKRMFLTTRKDGFMVVNLNDAEVRGATVLVAPREVYYGLDGEEYRANEEGEIVVGTLKSEDGLVLLRNKTPVVGDTKHTGSTDAAMKAIEFRDAICVLNPSASKGGKLTLSIEKERSLFDVRGHRVTSNENGEFVLPKLHNRRQVILVKDKSILTPKRQFPTFWEHFNMIFQRALLYIKHNW